MECYPSLGCFLFFIPCSRRPFFASNVNINTNISVNIASKTNISVKVNIAMASNASTTVTKALPVARATRATDRFIVFFVFSCSPCLANSRTRRLRFFVSNGLFGLVFASRHFFFY